MDYIFISGDNTDYDGVLAFSYYVSKSLEEIVSTNRDISLVYILNYPGYFNFTEIDDLSKESSVSEKQQFKRLEFGKGYGYSATELFNLRPLDKDAIVYASNNQIENNNYKEITKRLTFDMFELTFFEILEMFESLGVSGEIRSRLRLIFVDGGINSVNPFSIDTAKHEINMYSKYVNKHSQKKFNYTNFQNQKPEILSMRELMERVNETDRVKVDFCGSMSYLDMSEKDLDLFESKIIPLIDSVVIMGGVENDQEPNTLSATNFLNRCCTATMNQLYNPEQTLRFLNMIYKYEVKNIYVVSNNEINRNFNFGTYDKNIDDFSKKLVDLKLIGGPSTFTYDCLYEYYKSAGVIKPFDLYAAQVLTGNFDSLVCIGLPIDHVNSKLLFDKNYGFTILFEPSCKSWEDISRGIDKYINGVENKRKNVPENFKIGFKKEIDLFQSFVVTYDSIILDVIKCFI
jgi:hypothetical protein